MKTLLKTRDLRLSGALVTLCLLSGPALADPESWEVSCTSTTAGADGTTICNEGKMLPVSAPNLGQKMNLRIGAPTSHCSDITYVINRFPGGSTPIAVSNRLSPGQDQILELGEGWAEEGTYITITGVGHVGGCNVGEMHSWGALTEIYMGEPGPVAAGPAVLMENSLATECGASTPYEVTPGVPSMMCDRRIPVDFVSPGPGHDLEITLTAPATHCSSVTYFVARAGSSFTFGMSPRLSAGESTTISLRNDMAAGPQRVEIGAIGYVDGCNVGEIHSWGVDVRLMSLN
ncbi:MAG: hypothetical protein JNK19_07970 [Tabrizicola sp.]|nr:hypothetical protein [Tabrizicola sp.]